MMRNLLVLLALTAACSSESAPPAITDLPVCADTLSRPLSIATCFDPAADGTTSGACTAPTRPVVADVPCAVHTASTELMNGVICTAEGWCGYVTCTSFADFCPTP